jgi:crotonobetainyl-CoA:carnitine CoA-transferase CaiB-like acyl-CoA transferase
MIGSRILGDLGADVIKIEPPGGSHSRIAPYYNDIPHPEKSLYWFAYNANKRGITLDITRADGREIFKSLVKAADIVMESFEPGYMDQLGLGYAALNEFKPGIIVTSITPFGQNGPKAHYKGSELTAWASGGYLYICGDTDSPPVWMSFPHGALHSGAEAAAGTLTALWHRRKTGGEGQHVDVSMQECVVACNFNTTEMWDLNKVEFTRFSRGLNIGTRGVRVNAVWECKDGHTILIIQGGVQPFINSMNQLVDWMATEGMAEDWLKEMDWEKSYDASKLTQDVVDRVEDSIQKFVITKTKKELYEEGALKRRILIGPINSTKDIREDSQLEARGFWMPVKHPELGVTIDYPGPFIKLSKSQIEHRYRAPLIGEHNIEVYENELGFSRAELALLTENMII